MAYILLKEHSMQQYMHVIEASIDPAMHNMEQRCLACAWKQGHVPQATMYINTAMSNGAKPETIYH